MDAFDYVIVGGGSAASVLAYRLSAGGRHSLCVLEAGPPDTSLTLKIPAASIKLLRDPKLSWQFYSEGSAGTDGRRLPAFQGRTFGGSGSINGAIYVRGQAADFDHWQALGNAGWGYRDVLPYFKRSERRIGPGDDHYHGRSGRLITTTTRWRHPVSEAFIDAAVATGFPPNPDYDGPRQEGVGWYQVAVHRGRRVSAATAFLHPARRNGVDLRSHALVTRILFEGRRAVGVAYTRSPDKGSSGGPPIHVMARKEVLVCAGALNSPKLLQLSGIGPGLLLGAHGIAVVHDLPGVGENLHDHFGARLQLRVTGGDSINSRSRGLPLAAEVLKWLLGRPSVLELTPNIVFAFGKSRPALDRPDFALVHLPATYRDGAVRALDRWPGFLIRAWPLRPESRGHVRIRSRDPNEAPLIQPNYLAAEHDRRVVVAAMRRARRITESAALASHVASEVTPGRAIESDDELLHYVRTTGTGSYHFVGACKMGPAADHTSVVDERLRVHGIGGLRVIDSSIMPAIPSANTYAASLMIGEKAADMIEGKVAPSQPVPGDRG